MNQDSNEKSTQNGTQNGNDIPPALRDVANQLMDQARARRLQDLIDGKIPPPNQYAAFIIGQIKTVYEQAGQLDHQLGAAKAQVNSLQQQIVKLVGAAEQYAKDLETWDKPHEAVPTAPEAPQNGAHEPKAS